MIYPESYIESKVCKYARSKGWLVFKFVSPGIRGVPDRIFIKNGVTFFVEFKRKGAKPTAFQEIMINRIKSQDVSVYIIDEVFFGTLLIDLYEVLWKQQ